MAGIIAWAMGSGAKYIAFALLVVALFGGVWFYLDERDARVRAEVVAKAQAVMAAAELAQAKANVIAVQAAAEEAVTRAREVSGAKLEIAHAPPMVACVPTGPVLSALGSLRGPASAGGGAPGHPGVPVGVPAPAPPAKP